MDIERTVWVAYFPKKQKFASKTGFTNKFENSRIYSRKHYLISSIGRRMLASGEVIPVPIKIILEEITLITLKLGGSLDDIV